MMLAAVAPPEKTTTPEQEFWNWFQANEETLYTFTPDLNKDTAEMFGGVHAELRKIHPCLRFEFGFVLEEGGKKELVISAGGYPEAFPAVERLFAQAPKLDRWFWTKFKPRIPPDHLMLRYENISLNLDEVFFTAEAQGGEVDINLYLHHFRRRHERT